jgi:hypothetical protein
MAARRQRRPPTETPALGTLVVRLRDDSKDSGSIFRSYGAIRIACS